MTDETFKATSDRLTGLYINAHMKTKCGRKKGWYVQGRKEGDRILGICSKCGKKVEEYFSWKD